MRTRMRTTLYGVVQGVGLRPFVAVRARALALTGFVRNEGDRVVVEVEGAATDVEVLARELAAPPAPARVTALEQLFLAPRGDTTFAIEPSPREGPRGPVIPPDLAPCADCLRDYDDPTSRRHRHAFVSCTRCGPRASIARALPFDRERTTLVNFPLCDACARDYASPNDRRQHAQTLSCPRCGPRLILRDRDGAERPDPDPVSTVVAALRAGALVALAGVGGWQLLCDAQSPRAVATLRARKRRPRQPFAVLVADLDAAARLAYLDTDERRELTSAAAPIVLARAKPGSLAPEVAPAVPRLGLFLPSSPVHHALIRAFDGPLVCTSANLHGEPTPIDDEALKLLRGVADLFLTHDRPIARRLDDSVRQRAAGRLRTLRLGRGLAPLALPLRSPTPLLATGGHFASAPAAADGRHAYLGAHVGDLESPRARRAHAQAIDDLCALFALEPASVATDAHPDLASTRTAEQLNLPIVRVFHHHAHVAAVLAEHERERALGYAFDGFGLTPHGAGGGEVVDVSPEGARFVARLTPFAVVGLDRAAHDHARALAGLLLAAGLDPTGRAARFTPAARFATRTTSVGRLFDAVSTLLEVCPFSTYEGEAACALEAIALPGQPPYPFVVDDARLDWRPTIPALLRDRHDPPRAAGRFHATLAAMVAEHAKRRGAAEVVLAGGCFQNVFLLERTLEELDARGLRAWIAEQVPPGDGGLALGQLRVAASAAGSSR